MNILFIHQNFPGQYRHIIKHLSATGSNQIIGLGIQPLKTIIPKNVTYIRYMPKKGNTPGIHPFALETETKIIRGEACAEKAYELKKNGFVPDLICAHPGWGESLFIKDIWPKIPLLSYQEFYYHHHGYDYNFDEEFKRKTDWANNAKIRMKNSFLQLTLEASDWNVSATRFQKQSFPEIWQQKFSVIHDGIDTNIAKPNSKVEAIKLKSGAILDGKKPIVTYVNRALEPHRGCHSVIRAIPTMHNLNSEMELIIVGDASSQYGYGKKPKNETWKDIFLKEIEGSYDPNRVHFVGTLEYNDYIKLLQLSKAHIYLTYPFVLSWSMLEAMSIGCPVIASNTEPVLEIINDKVNGIIVDFFNPDMIAKAVIDMIADDDLAKQIGFEARKTIQTHYELKRCVSKQIALIELMRGENFYP